MRISVIIPVYNGEWTLKELLFKIEKALSPLADLEVIMVYDCGPDKSWEVIKEIKKNNPGNISGIKLKRNYGQHTATSLGLVYSTGDLALTIDEDMQYDPGDIRPLIELAQTGNPDLVYGIPSEQFHAIIKRTGSSLLKAALKFRESRFQSDYSSLRVLHRTLINSILSSDHPLFFIDAPLIKLCSKAGHLRLNHYPRKSGSSSYTLLKLVKHAIKILLVYTMLFKRIVILNSVLALACLVYLVKYWTVVNWCAPAILFLLSVILIFTGFLFLLKKRLSRFTFNKLKNNPEKIISEII